MNKNKVIYIYIFILLLIFLIPLLPAKEMKIIDIKGSSSVNPWMQAVKNENKDKYKVVISAQGSGTGIKSIFDNKTDIAMSSRDLKDDEKAIANKKNITDKVVALDGISIITNKKNKVKNITMSQIHDIFVGKIKNWKDIDPKMTGQIKVLAQGENAGTREGFDHVTKTKDKLPNDVIQRDTNGEVIRFVEENESAISYISSGANLKTLSVLNVDNVTPTLENIKSKKYKLYRGFHLLYKKENKKASEFMNYLGQDKQLELLNSKKHNTHFVALKGESNEK